MKPIQSFFAGLAVLLMMGACAQSIGQPGPDVQSSATTIVTLTSASTAVPSASVTPIPPPTRRLTATVSPTATFTPPTPSITPGGPTSYPTLTPVPTITPTNTRFVLPPIGGGPVQTSTPVGLGCSVSASYPLWGQVFTQRTDFIALWRVNNVGRDMWRMGDVFFEYESGTKMHSRDRDATSLPVTIYSKDKIDLHIRMKTPKEPGYYTTTFGLRKSNKPDFFCTFSVTVSVVKKK